ncbi:putative HTH-type transcriptional regulator TcmR [Pseudomonas cichorii]|uniref:Putative HTH-type transcriptional regulator TcmR n=1 Tax=Pseudomonas cichorii TaxID=36746 RepID=A0A3M4M1T1_PSECI|nr:TetR/AcrR family transcriptional regulator [Pseudomonas cichorii]RMQ47659.1 putative HTH-type transcriptional regulator TcmR [Pseudomonas cichorii]
MDFKLDLYYRAMKKPTHTPSAAEVAPLSLRERTRLAMRAEVSDVAFRLFAEQGFEKTTVDQIASEAGLSRTTLFRYFGTKEEIVLGKLVDIGHEIAKALAARPLSERPWQALRRAFDVVIETIDGDPDQSLPLMRLLGEACALTTRQWEKKQGWQSILVPEISRRLADEGQIAADLHANALVSAVISCFDTAIDVWTASEGRVSLAGLLDQAMSALCELGE